MYKRILIQTDGSEYTKVATMRGLEMAKLTGAEVTVLFVIDDDVYMSKSWAPSLPMPVSDLTPALEDEGKKAVHYVRSEGEKTGVKVTSRIESGSPAR